MVDKVSAHAQTLSYRHYFKISPGSKRFVETKNSSATRLVSQVEAAAILSESPSRVTVEDRYVTIQNRNRWSESISSSRIVDVSVYSFTIKLTIH